MVNNFDDDLSLTPTVESLEKLIGGELSGKLSAELGGRKLYIPVKAGANSPMTMVIGIDAANKISAVYGGLHFDVPLRAGTKKMIIDLYRAGENKVQIAAKLRVSRTYVHKVVNEYEDDKSQLNFSL